MLLGACRSSEDAMLRGDRYWADSNYVAALAEYRLAARQGGSEATARVAHAYIVTGQLDRARSAYNELMQLEPGAADQAVFDYLWLARTNLERGDRYGAARAAEAALELRPDLRVTELALTIARHYATIGETERSLQFFRRALGSAEPAARVGLLYETAVLAERNGDCVAALPYFEAYAEQATHPDSITEARWRMGTCGLERGRQLLQAGDPANALRLLDLPIALGAPQNLLDQAWFERGEALLAMGRADEAGVAYQRVLDYGVAGRTQLAARATRRLAEIRAGPVP